MTRIDPDGTPRLRSHGSHSELPIIAGWMWDNCGVIYLRPRSSTNDTSNAARAGEVSSSSAVLSFTCNQRSERDLSIAGMYIYNIGMTHRHAQLQRRLDRRNLRLCAVAHVVEEGLAIEVTCGSETLRNYKQEFLKNIVEVTGSRSVREMWMK